MVLNDWLYRRLILYVTGRCERAEATGGALKPSWLSSLFMNIGVLLSIIVSALEQHQSYKTNSRFRIKAIMSYLMAFFVFRYCFDSVL